MLRELAADAETIVRAHVTAETPFTENLESRFPNEWTIYRVLIVEVLAGNDVIPSGTDQLSVFRVGQRRGIPAQDRVLDDEFAPFSIGSDYVLFLNRATGTRAGMYVVSHVGAGAYEIVMERVIPLAEEAVALRQRGRTYAAFSAELRTLATKSVRDR